MFIHSFMVLNDATGPQHYSNDIFVMVNPVGQMYAYLVMMLYPDCVLCC